MQKELKIGLAIGAVLLVVLIVYVAVPKSDPAQVAGGADVSTDVEDAQAASPDAGSATDAGVSTSAFTGGDKPGTNDVFLPEDASRATAESSAQAKADANTDWGKLLETGQLPERTVTPSLRNVSTVPDDVKADSADDPAADPEPVFTGGDARSTSDGTGSGFPTSDVGATALPTRDSSASSGARTHVVQRGENYSTIAKQAYGDARHYLAIQKANPTLDPARLRPGVEITLPDINAAKSESTGSAAPSESSTASDGSAKKLDSETEYRVQSGDSLYKISEKRYGTPNMIEAIYSLNRATIGDDSARLKVGTVLKLPPSPARDTPAR